MMAVSVIELKKVLSKSSINDTWSQIDEIYPGLFLGGRKGAQNIPHLKSLGISHIVNVDHEPTEIDIPKWYPQSKDLPKRHNANSYKKEGFDCEYLGIGALDHHEYDMSVHFHNTSEFIENALSSTGKVLVHCYMGVSRSATIVIAFLMIKRNFSATEAVELVRSKRCVIFPNDGFLKQIIELESALNKQTKSRSIEVGEKSQS